MDQLITIGKINITQLAVTAIAIIGVLGIVFASFRQAFFKAWTDWKISQLESNNQVLKKQAELQAQLEGLLDGQDSLRHTINTKVTNPQENTND